MVTDILTQVYRPYSIVMIFIGCAIRGIVVPIFKILTQFVGSISCQLVWELS